VWACRFTSGWVRLTMAVLAALAAGPTAAQEPTPSVRQLLFDARQCIETDRARAMELARRAIGGDATSAEAHYVLGRCHQRFFDQTKAVQAFTRATELDPRYPEGWVGLGDALLLVDPPDVAGARRAFERGWAESPDFVPALYGLAQVEMADGRSDRARERLTAVLQKDPNHPRAHLDLGMELYAAGELEKAKVHLLRAAELTPEDPLPYFTLALVHDGLGDAGAALSAYDRAIAIDPADTAALYNKAVLLEELGQTAEALAVYEQVQAKDPNSPEASSRALQLLHLMGRDSEAIARLREMLRATPGDVALRLRLANAYIACGKRREALGQLGRILAADPASIPANRALAMITEQDEDYALAASHYRALVEAEPGVFAHRQALVRNLVKAGRKEEALGLARTAVKGEDDPAGRQLLVQTLASCGQGDAALQEAQSLLLVFPGDAATLSYTASALEERGRLGEAVSLYRRAAEITPDDRDLRFRYGRALDSVGRIEEALAEYRCALDPRNPASAAQDGIVRCLKALGQSGDVATALVVQSNATPQDFRLALDAVRACLESGRAGDVVPLAVRTLLNASTDAEEEDAFRVLAQVGDVEALAIELKRAFGVRPTSRIAAALTRLLSRAGSGKRWAQTTISLASDSPRHAAMAIDALVDGGHLEDAAVEVDRLVAVYGGCVEVRLSAGRVYERLGDLASAGKQYQAALDLAPGNADAGSGLERVRR